MNKFLIGCIIGILIGSMITEMRMSSTLTDTRINAGIVASKQFRKGLELGIEWQKTIEEHNRLMERE